MISHSALIQSLDQDMLEGADAIAAFLGSDWNARRVYHAREVNALPIRKKPLVGIYAFRSELLAALKAPETRTDLTADRA